MARFTPVTRIGLPLAVGGLAWACSRPDAAQDAEVGATTVDSAAPGSTATRLQVANVMIGKTVGAGNMVTEPTFQFLPKDTVRVSVATAGPGSGMLTAAWRSQGGEILQKTSEMSHAAGENTVFSLSQPKGFKPGTYKVVVFLDNDSVDTKVFVIGK
jgi:hypothetical protein